MIKDPTPSTPRFTVAGLDAFPVDDGKRYEIIDGELYVSTQPHLYHQSVIYWLAFQLQQWSQRSGNYQAFFAPGIIFAEDDAVAPDVIWISSRRLATALWPDGKLHSAPELIVEVLSPGPGKRKTRPRIEAQTVFTPRRRRVLDRRLAPPKSRGLSP